MLPYGEKNYYSATAGEASSWGQALQSATSHFDILKNAKALLQTYRCFTDVEKSRFLSGSFSSIYFSTGFVKS